MILLLTLLSVLIRITNCQLYQNTLQLINQNIKEEKILQSFYQKNIEENQIHDQYFKKYLDLLEKVDEMYDQQEKLLQFNEANIEYVIKRTKKNYNDQLIQLSNNIEKNNEQVIKTKENIADSRVQQEDMISGILEVVSTIKETLKDNFSLNFHRVMPILNQKIQSGFFDKLSKLKTLDYQLLVKELERYQSFGQQIKESKKKELAHCYSLISSVLKQAQILLMSEFQQVISEQQIKLILLREENKQLQSQLIQLKRLKRLVEDSQEFKQTLIKQYRDNIKFIQNKKIQFRDTAKQIIESNQNVGKLFKTIYILAALLYLIPFLNPIQKIFISTFKGIITYVQIAMWLLAGIFLFGGLQTLEIINLEQFHLSTHLEQTSKDYIIDKDDLFRLERNIYLIGGCFFITLANVRFLGLADGFYKVEDQKKQLEKILKEQ